MPPPQATPQPHCKEFFLNPGSDPGDLTREMKPVEVGEWKKKFLGYLRDGVGRDPSSELIV